MAKRLMGQLHRHPIVTDDDVNDNESRLAPAYDFSWASIEDLAQMLIDCARAGFEEDAEFVNAVREEIGKRRPMRG